MQQQRRALAVWQRLSAGCRLCRLGSAASIGQRRALHSSVALRNSADDPAHSDDEPIVRAACVLDLVSLRRCAENAVLLCMQARKMAFIGAGKMAEAILGGLPPVNWESTRACDFNEPRMRVFRERFGIDVVKDSLPVVKDADVVSAQKTACDNDGAGITVGNRGSCCDFEAAFASPAALTRTSC
jgi:hypothetical protein